MSFRLSAILGAIALCFSVLPTAWASDTGGQLLYVDASSTTSSDANPGTADRPLRTISRAIVLADDANSRGTATTVRIAPGVYRERVDIRAAATEASLTLEASGPGVVVSGADRWSQWTAGSNGVFSATWPYRWGLAPVPSGWPTVEPLLRRREIVAVDGTILRQVLTAAELSAHNGAFMVDETAGTLMVRPPQGVDLQTAAVDVATRSHTMTIQRRHNVTIRGLSFRHAATDIQRGSVLVDGARNLMVTDSRFEQNNWAGLQLLNVDGVTLRRVALDRNGVMGLTAWRVRDLLVEDSHNSHNNLWRGAWANYANWEDGLKIAAARRVTFRRHTSVGNRGNGLWFDGDVAGVTVEDSFLADNSRYGMFTEISQGPFLIRNNRICGNGITGLMNVKSRDVTVDGNQIFSNAAEAIAFSGPVGPVTITDFETQTSITLRNEDYVLRNNVLAQGAARLVRNNLQPDDWDYLKRTFVASGNRWHSTHSGPFTLPGVWVDFAKWRNDTGQDATSVYSAPDTALTCTTSVAPPPEPAPEPVSEDTSSPTEPVAEGDDTVIKDETRIGKPLKISRKK